MKKVLLSIAFMVAIGATFSVTAQDAKQEGCIKKTECVKPCTKTADKKCTKAEGTKCCKSKKVEEKCTKSADHKCCKKQSKKK